MGFWRGVTGFGFYISGKNTYLGSVLESLSYLWMFTHYKINKTLVLI